MFAFILKNNLNESAQIKAIFKKEQNSGKKYFV